MKVVLEVSDFDTVLLGLTSDMDIAEKLIVDKFKEQAIDNDELVSVEYKGKLLYTIRNKTEVYQPDSDGFEYEDNEGNPINADGSPKVSDDLDDDIEIVDDTPEYEYEGEFIWIVSDVEPDQPLNLVASEYIDLFKFTTDPFQADENLVLVTSS